MLPLAPDLKLDIYGTHGFMMERTLKPWEVKEKKHSRDKRTHDAKSKSSGKAVESSAHENLLQNLVVSARKRNPQRDAIQPSLRSTAAQSSSGPSKRNNGPKRPLIQATSSPSRRSPLGAPMHHSPSQSPRPSSSDAAALNINPPEMSISAAHLTEAGQDEPPSPPPRYEVTEWTAFLDRIQDNHSSATYEVRASDESGCLFWETDTQQDLLLLEEVNGPSTSRHVGGRSLDGTDRLLSASVGQVEVLYRRTTKEGKAKLKLALAGVRVDKCSICLAQFRSGERAVLTYCNHSFHESCLQRWVARSSSCPVCRLALAPD